MEEPNNQEDGEAPVAAPAPSPTEERRGQIAVRSTVYLQGAPRGQLLYVDSDDPYIAGLLRGGILVVAPGE